MQAEHKNPSKSPWLFVLSPKIILSPKTLDYAFQRWMIHNIFRMVKPSNPVNRLSLKYIFRQSDFQINWFGNSLFSSPQISRKIKLWDKVYQCKFTKAYKGKREEEEWERIWDWKKNKQPSLLKLLECKVNGHYLLVKQSSHFYSFLISGRTAYVENNSFALPWMGNSLLECCCRAQSQGQERYCASTEEQARRACP